MVQILSLIGLVVWVGLGAAAALPYYQEIRTGGEPPTSALLKAILHGAITPPKKAVEGLTALIKYLTS